MTLRNYFIKQSQLIKIKESNLKSNLRSIGNSLKMRLFKFLKRIMKRVPLLFKLNGNLQVEWRI